MVERFKFFKKREDIPEGVPIEAASIGPGGADYVVREEEIISVQEKKQKVPNDGSKIFTTTQDIESFSPNRKYRNLNWSSQEKGDRKSRNKWARHDKSGIGNRHSNWKDLRDEEKI